MNNLLFKAIKYDIKKAILKRWLILIPIAFLFFLSSIECRVYINNFVGHGAKANFIDYIIYFFKGNKEFVPGEKINISIFYLMFVCFISFLITYYPTSELKEFDKVYMLSFRSKLYWWISKSVWSFLTIVIFYATGLLVIFVFTILNGGDISLHSSGHMSIIFDGYNITVGGIKLLLGTVVLHIVILTAMMQFIITAQMIISPVMAYVFTLIYFIASAFFIDNLLLGNGLMFYRSELIRDDGANIIIMMIISIILWIVSFITGYLFFEKKDII